jgi:uncharacterized protein
MERFRSLLFTPNIKAIQSKQGSRAAYARGENEDNKTPDPLGEDEADFLAERDSFYMASVGESGWPYVQHRGGPKGFIRVLDPNTIGFADLRGNRQYISVGNLSYEDRVALIFVDYPRRSRLKLIGHARTINAVDDGVLFERLVIPGYDAKIERGIVIRVEGLDWNCPQHITPRYTEQQVQAGMAPIRERLAQLEKENQELRARLPPLK